MKKCKIYGFDPVIYPRMVFVAIGIDAAYLKERFYIYTVRKDEVEIAEKEKDIYGIGWKVYELKTLRQGILMCFYDTKIPVKTIAHESVHIADYIFEEVHAVAQDFSDKDEPFCYLVEWIANCLDKIRTHKIK